MPQRGNIAYDLIQTAARQGAGPKFTMYNGSAPVSGHVGVFDAGGSLIDGGPLSGSYVLPPATATALGGVIIGANITVQANGTISVAAPAAPYVLPPATATVLGGVKIGSGITVAGDGTISVTPGAGGYWQAGSPAGAIYYSGGSVGVGLSSPQYTFDVNGTIHGNQTISVDSSIFQNLWNDGSNWRYTDAGPCMYIIPLPNTGIVFGSAPTGTAGAVANVVWKMVFADNGMVGIGIGAPTAPLTVNITTDRDFRTYWDSNMGAVTVNAANDAGNTIEPLGFNASKYMFINGNVGIGTTAPYTTLDVNGTVRATNNVTPTSGPGLELGYGSGYGGILQAYDRTAGTFQPIHANGNPLLLNVDSGGNVGIGTPSPTSMLDVVGNIRMSGTRSVLFTRGDTDNMRSGVQFICLDNSGINNVWTPTDINGNPASSTATVRFGGQGAFNTTVVNVAVSGTLGIGSNAANLASANTLLIQPFMSGNWALANIDTNMQWNGSAYVRLNSAYPGIQTGAAVLNNGTADASWGVSYLNMSNSLQQLFSAQMYQNSQYCTLSAGSGANIDSQLTINGQWYSYMYSTAQLAIRVRCLDGNFRNVIFNLS